MAIRNTFGKMMRFKIDLLSDLIAQSDENGTDLVKELLEWTIETLKYGSSSYDEVLDCGKFVADYIINFNSCPEDYLTMKRLTADRSVSCPLFWVLYYGGGKIGTIEKLGCKHYRFTPEITFTAVPGDCEYRTLKEARASLELAIENNTNEVKR